MLKLQEFQGHIHNRKALIKELELISSQNKRKDEEAILLKAYKTWGSEMGLHVYGSFSVIFHDEEKGSFILVRDPFGTKPLYYTLLPDGVFLSSTEMKTILNNPGFHKELNEDFLQIYLTMTYLPFEHTFFRNLKRVLPGHVLIYNEGNISDEAYFKPEFTPLKGVTEEAFQQKIHETVKEIMEEIVDEDEYAEAFLSSGVDSSYMVAMSHVNVTNSCGYLEKKLDESELASETSKLLHRTHRTVLITKEQYFDAIPPVLYTLEEPTADASAIAFALTCKEVSKHASICFSGEGADEFFAGYNMYARASVYGDNLRNFYIGNTNIMKEEEKKALLLHYKEHFLPIDLVKHLYTEEEFDPLSKMLEVDISTWLDGNIYLNVARMGAATHVDVRMPFSDLRLFRVASKIPTELKITEEQRKYVFRKAASTVLPDEIAFRKKLGFSVPIRAWLADESCNQDVHRQFESENAKKFFHVEALKDLFNRFKNENSDLWRQVYTIYTFLVWYEQYFS